MDNKTDFYSDSELSVDGSTYSHIISGEQMSLDELAKKLISSKGALSIIIKHLIDDCGGYTYKEIGDMIGNISMRQHVTADVNSDGAWLLSTESSSVLEKLIRYDVYLNFREKGRISTIDIEIQQELPSEYPLIKRGLYYACRAFCSQLGDITGVTDYGALHKVYSIWLMVKQPEDSKAGIVTYKFDRFGDVWLIPPDFDGNDDLIQLDFVFAGNMDEAAMTRKELFFLVNGMLREPGLLRELFNYELPEQTDFIKEADDIMTAEEIIRTRGKEEGKAEGKAEKSAEVALNMYLDGMSTEKISKYTKLSLEEIDKLIENSRQSPAEPYALS